MPVDLDLEFAVRNLLRFPESDTGEAYSLTTLALILKKATTQVKVVLDELIRRGHVSSSIGLAHFPVKKNGKVELVSKKATLYYSIEPRER